MTYGKELEYEMEMGQRLASLTGVNENEINAEWAVTYRMRLEGVSVWWGGFGHVLYPLNFTLHRKAFEAMLQAQDEKTRNAVNDALNYCLENDPFQLDANYPLLEYYLWTVMYLCVSTEQFRPLAIPVEICDWIQSIKPEEYIHYRPVDWCYECGCRYPAVRHGGVGHDAERFLLTRYTKDEIKAMETPFRGKACLICGGEVMDERWRGTDKMANSPAGRLSEAKCEEWRAELESATGGFADLQCEFNLFDRDRFKDAEDAAEAEFRDRRARRPGVRVEHRPSVNEILRMRTR